MSTPPATSLPSRASRRPRFRLLDAAAVAALPRPECLVEDMLVEKTLAVLYAAAGAGKSFIALDLGLAVAMGLPWHGRRVRRGVVVYVAAEGGAGIGHRVRAWQSARQVDRIDGAWFVLERVNLLDGQEVAALIEATKMLSAPVALVIIDTLARCLVGGDENSAKDMGVAVASLDRIRESLSCSVLLLHHTARHHDAERGSTALRGAADTMLAVTLEGDTVTITCGKQKDAAAFAEIVLQLVPTDESCTLSAAETKQPAGPTGTVRVALRVLAEVADDDGASYTRWFKATKLEETTFGRARKVVLTKGWVSKTGERHTTRYRVTPAGSAALDTGSYQHGTSTPANAGPVITSIHPRASIGSAGDAGDGVEDEVGSV